MYNENWIARLDIGKAKNGFVVLDNRTKLDHGEDQTLVALSRSQLTEVFDQIIDEAIKKMKEATHG